MELTFISGGLLLHWLLRIVMVLAISTACLAGLLLLRDGAAALRSRLRRFTIVERWYGVLRAEQEGSGKRYTPLRAEQSAVGRVIGALRPAWSSALVILAGLVMVRDAPLAAMYLLAMSAPLYGLERRTRTAGFNEEAFRAIDDLIRRFQRGFRVDRVVFPVLGDLVRDGKLRPEVAPLVEEAVTRYRKGAAEDEALEALQGYNLHLDSFVMVLRQATTAPYEAVSEALEEVHQRLRQHRQFNNKAQTSMAQARLQFAIMRLVFFVIILVIVTIPALRDFYAVSWSRQALFVGIITLGLAGIAYFNQEKYSLQLPMI